MTAFCCWTESVSGSEVVGKESDFAPAGSPARSTRAVHNRPGTSRATACLFTNDPLYGQKYTRRGSVVTCTMAPHGRPFRGGADRHHTRALHCQGIGAHRDSPPWRQQHVSPPDEHP